MFTIRLVTTASDSRVQLRDMVVLAMLGVLMVGCQALDEASRRTLALQADAVLNGEVWRMFSAYCVHANWQHLGINAASMVAVLCLFPEMLRQYRALLALAINALLVGLVLIVILPGAVYYYGFSALLYAFIGTCVVSLLKHNPFSKWVLGYLIAKTAWEQIVGPLSGSEALVEGKVAIEAHLAGALVGMGTGILVRVFVNLKQQPDTRGG